MRSQRSSKLLVLFKRINMSLQIKRLKAASANFKSSLKEMLAWETMSDDSVRSVVVEIIDDVKNRGDESVLQWSNKFDQLNAQTMSELQLEPERLKQSLENLPDEQGQALRTAAQRIRSYHERQKQGSWQYKDTDGSEYGQKVTPLNRVGLYVPGGKASYPSTVLMSAIPARVAGVGEIIVTLPTPKGIANELVLIKFSPLVVPRQLQLWLMVLSQFLM
jgi:histidinol dehydrogenase